MVKQNTLINFLSFFFFRIVFITGIYLIGNQQKLFADNSPSNTPSSESTLDENIIKAIKIKAFFSTDNDGESQAASLAVAAQTYLAKPSDQNAKNEFLELHNQLLNLINAPVAGQPDIKSTITPSSSSFTQSLSTPNAFTSISPAFSMPALPNNPFNPPTSTTSATPAPSLWGNAPPPSTPSSNPISNPTVQSNSTPPNLSFSPLPTTTPASQSTPPSTPSLSSPSTPPAQAPTTTPTPAPSLWGNSPPPSMLPPSQLPGAAPTMPTPAATPNNATPAGTPALPTLPQFGGPKLKFPGQT